MKETALHSNQWQKCLQYLSDNLSAEQFNAWFAPISVYSFKDGELTLRVPSQFFIEQIEERYCSLLSSTLRKVYGT
ncbi:MAG: chromosomal replication initiator protein DnaA, partial [Muribaculaceae bacterium]|nr:chromosomal replication initiator protein DnaA [Muribaculaceae bacterium]